MFKYTKRWICIADLNRSNNLQFFANKFDKPTSKTCYFIKNRLIMSNLSVSSKPSPKFNLFWPLRYVLVSSWNCSTLHQCLFLQGTRITSSLFIYYKILSLWKIAISKFIKYFHKMCYHFLYLLNRKSYSI